METDVESSFATFTPTPERVAQAVAQLVRLVDVDSTSGAEEPAVAVAEAICGELGLPCRRMPVAPGRDNLLVGAPDAAVMLCTHLDTVPPFIGASVDATHVHGRGACDAKGAAVAMLHALRLLRDEGAAGERVGCLLVVGEEADHIGAKAAVATGLRPAHVILGEPCGIAPAVAQKGLLKLAISASGSAGHSAYPELGTSAVHTLMDALYALRHETLPHDAALGETTVNVGEIHGGVAANVIAPEARATVLIRCAAPVDAVLAAVRDLVPPPLTIVELSRSEPREFLTGGGPVGPAVPFNTDANWMAATGAAMMLLGPGDMRCAHGPHEHLAIADLAAGMTAYAREAARLL
ncbi:MAG: M20/M25/M40 family metallo-hydrolase [Deltaproteobacteria bacterium]|nr:MAG: M20/M25/M40 family metallo-hydrolase [Deltaproteobacteria bacterium]